MQMSSGIRARLSDEHYYIITNFDKAFLPIWQSYFNTENSAGDRKVLLHSHAVSQMKILRIAIQVQ